MARVDFGYSDVDEDDKPRLVRSLFDSVASRYDIMNDVMSLGVHRYWKRVLLGMINPRPEQFLLDVAGGSGDIVRGFLRGGGGGAVICDISENMLGEARSRSYDGGYFSSLDVVCGSAEALPFADCSVDVYTIGFGLRNVTDKDLALREAYRVLRRGGHFLCLEFSPQVSPIISGLYDAYSFKVIPALGGLIARDSASYRYLVESIRRFPPPLVLRDMVSGAGFSTVSYRLLSQGIVAIHSGWKV